MNDHTRNSDANEEPAIEPWVDPEVEARIVAWVAGEASPFEAAELARLIAEKPELALFKQRIEEVQRVVKDAVQADEQPLRLSAERRAKVIEVMGEAPASPPPEIAPEPIPMTQRKPAWWRNARFYYAAVPMTAAASFAVLLALRTASTVDYRERASPTALSSGHAAPASDVAQRKIEREAKQREVGVKAALELQDKVRAEQKAREEQLANQAAALPAAWAQSPQSVAEAKKQALAFAPSAARGSSRTELTRPPAEDRGYFFAASAGGGAAGASQVKEAGSLNLGAITTGGLSLSTLANSNEPSAGSITLGGTAPNAPVTVHFGSAINITAPTVNGGVVMPSDKSLTVLGPTPSTPAPQPPLQVKFDSEATLVVRDAAFDGTPAGKRDAATAPAEGSIRLDAFVVQAPSQSPTSDADSARKVARLNLDDATREGAASRPSPQASPPPAAAEAETTTAQQPVSTFSLHVSDVSFRLAQASLNTLDRGQEPKSFPMRVEEFYNAFDYGDPRPTVSEKVAARIEQSAHPFLQQRNFLRVAMRVAATGRAATQPLRLTVLLDTSGSMEREDRAAAVRRAFEVLVSLLGPNDRLTLIGFSRTPRLLAENLPGNQAQNALELARRTPAEGGTNIEEALKLARELALRHRDTAAQNRIVVLTDGAANLGNAEPAQLAALVESLRQQGIAFDACGIGLEGTGDAVLEALTRKGNGRYYVVDSAEAADAGFARQLAGAFRPAAENVKLQVRFNPARVGRYRLIGFDSHRLHEQDFRNDAIDAAELAAEEAGVALYQIEVLPEGTGEVGEVFVRFRDAASGQMVERSWPIAYEPTAPRFDRASPSLRLAGVAAMFAEKFDGRDAARQFKLGDLAPVVNALRGHYAQQPRVQEFVTMFAQARRIAGE